MRFNQLEYRIAVCRRALEPNATQERSQIENTAHVHILV